MLDITRLRKGTILKVKASIVAVGDDTCLVNFLVPYEDIIIETGYIANNIIKHAELVSTPPEPEVTFTAEQREALNKFIMKSRFSHNEDRCGWGISQCVLEDYLNAHVHLDNQTGQFPGYCTHLGGTGRCSKCMNGE